MLRLALAGFSRETSAILPRLRNCTCFESNTIDLGEVLTTRAADFDAIAVQTNDLSVGQLRDCASRQKHLLIDTPSPLPERDLSELATAYSAAQLCLTIARPERFQPSIRTLKQSIDAGQLGSPGLVRIHRWEPTPDALPDVPVRDHLATDVDLACWLVGETPHVVYATGPALEVAYMQVHLGFPSGAMALIDRACDLPPGGDYFSLSVIGSDGSAYADDHHNQQLVFGGGHPRARRTDRGALHQLGMLQHFVDTIPCPEMSADPTQAISLSAELIDAIRHSQASKQAVNV